MIETTLEARKQRWLEFYDLASPRRVAYLLHYAPGLPSRPLEWLKEIPVNAHVVLDITIAAKDEALRI